jgi:RNA-directed DNA polymerase
VLDDFSRYIVAWRIGPTMCASDVTATLHQALAASGLDHVHRILLDNYYLPGDLERQIGAVVEHYNHVRYHESINNACRRLLRPGRDDPD